MYIVGIWNTIIAKQYLIFIFTNYTLTGDSAIHFRIFYQMRP